MALPEEELQLPLVISLDKVPLFAWRQKKTMQIATFLHYNAVRLSTKLRLSFGNVTLIFNFR